jgi:hypothetical protein
LTKRYAAGAETFVNWRWFSGGIPPYWEGSFRGDACITLLPSTYVSLEMKPDRNTWMTITARC